MVGTLNILLITALVIAAFGGGVAVMWFIHAKARREESQDKLEDLTPRESAPSPDPSREPPRVEAPEPEQLVFANADGDHALIVSEVSEDIAPHAFVATTEVRGAELNMLSRLSGLIAAAPSASVAAAAHGKRLMEVQVNGDLVRAADGNGFRAFVMGPRGIKENARLFDVKHLDKLANAAAVWQIASVLVAQKHLADISQKLDEIREIVAAVSEFQKNKRKATIKGSAEYLVQVHQALQGGCYDEDMCKKLEDIELEMLAVQEHISGDFRGAYKKEAKHDDFVGTQDLFNNVKGKIARVAELKEEYMMCLSVRAMGCYLLSLYPGKSQLAITRRAVILKHADTFSDDIQKARERLIEDTSRMDAWFNFKSTLDERKEHLLGLIEQRTIERISNDGMEREFARLARPDGQARYLIEYDNNKLLGIHKRH